MLAVSTNQIADICILTIKAYTGWDSIKSNHIFRLKHACLLKHTFEKHAGLSIYLSMP